MCYQFYHQCRFCHNQYECDLPNYICPTVNNDVDKKMCDQCRKAEAEAFRKWTAEEGNKIPKSLDEWEKQ